MSMEEEHDKLLSTVFEDKTRFNHVCKNFDVGGKLSNTLFEVHWNHPSRIHVFLKKNNFTQFLRSERKTRIKNQNTLNLGIVGVMGTGKSYGTHRLALEYQQDFRNLYRRGLLFEEALMELHKIQDPIKIHLTWDDAKFLRYLSSCDYGSLVIRDESSRTSSTDSLAIADAIKNMIEEIRKNQNSIILVFPNKKKAKAFSEEGILHFFLQTAGMKIIEGEDYEIRFIVRDSNFKPVGRIIIPLDFDNELAKSINYSEQKDENILLIKASQGFVNPELSEGDKPKQDAERLLKYCLGRGLLNRRDIELEGFPDYNTLALKEKRLTDIISGSGNRKQKIIQKVFNTIKSGKTSLYTEKEKKEVKKPTESSEFVAFLKDYYENRLTPFLFINQKSNIEKKKVIEVLECIVYGMGQRDISVNVEGLHAGLIVDISKLFQDGRRAGASITDELRLYRCYENWCAKITDSKLISGKGKIDLGKYYKGVLCPIECKTYNRNQNSINIKKDKIHAYYEYKDILHYIPVMVRNFKRGDMDYIFMVETSGGLSYNFQFKEENIFNGKFTPEEYFIFKKKVKGD